MRCRRRKNGAQIRKNKSASFCLTFHVFVTQQSLEEKRYFSIYARDSIVNRKKWLLKEKADNQNKQGSCFESRDMTIFSPETLNLEQAGWITRKSECAVVIQSCPKST